MTEIDEAIRELTNVGGARRLWFVADIGNVDETSVNWIFGGRRVEMPRVVFEYEREPRANFWLVSVAERAAAIYGITDLAITDAEVAGHRERIKCKQLSTSSA